MIASTNKIPNPPPIRTSTWSSDAVDRVADVYEKDAGLEVVMLPLGHRLNSSEDEPA